MLQKRYDAEAKFRPIRPDRPWPPADLQAIEPAGWCVRCGGEIFRPKKELCSRCAKMERRKQNEKGKESQSVSVLYTGN